VILDECGYSTEPVRRRTWAAVGQTPTIRPTGTRRKLTATAALEITPEGRVNERFQLHEKNTDWVGTLEFLLKLRDGIRRPMIVVLDRLGAHRKAARLLRSLGIPWVEFAWLPPYAPDLNPVEDLWSVSKAGDLANYTPDTLEDLRHHAAASLARRGKPASLRSMFAAAKLRL